MELPEIESPNSQTPCPRRRPWIGPVVLVAGAALVMGLPTVRGGFVGGDDHRLVLNHVFVNHPSPSHAVKLFATPHRDLYQPLPLLTYQIEFATAQALELFDEGPQAGAWLFHLTNVLLHAVNTVLVWAVVTMLCVRLPAQNDSASEGTSEREVSQQNNVTGYAIATVAALLFAVHPLQTEVIAWLNGRMMLLSTLFAMASLLALASWLDRPRWSAAILTIVLVLLSTISKVRIGLPVLLLIVLVARRSKPSWRFALIWLGCTVVTAVFVVVNIRTTAQADLFAQGAEHLQGPRIVRVLLALGWYFQHMVWPVGLASYYPTPPIVAWSDPATWRAVAIVGIGFAIFGWACWRSRAAQLGVVWFFATLASTLPIIPARNILAADRYMYLPIIGMFWIAGTLAYAIHERGLTKWSASLRRVAVATVAFTLVVPSIAMGWYVASFYETPLKKTQRIVDLFPDTPRVWEPLGRTLLSEGYVQEAIEAAKMELRHDVPNIRSGAYQLLGKCELARGNTEAGIDYLRRALDAHPKSGLARYELGKALAELGQTDEATGYLEEAVRIAPTNNPTIRLLASICRRQGRAGDARELYNRAVENNAYEFRAIMGLAELDIEEGTRESLLSAERRLLGLLAWMSENSAAWTNLGVVYSAMGRPSDAIDAYQEALSADTNNVTALVNIAQIHHARGELARARDCFDRAAAVGLMTIDEALTVHDFYVSQEKPERAVRLWEVSGKHLPDSPSVRALLGWAHALSGSLEEAAGMAGPLVTDSRASPWAMATLAYVDLVRGQYPSATQRTVKLCELGDGGADARQRLLGALERFDQQQPGIPWTFCLVAQLLLADGNVDVAREAIKQCEERCQDDPCRDHVQVLRTQLTTSKTATP